jgi:2-dehydro-3-deoxygluconokinase
MHDLVTLGEVLLRLSVPSPGRFETARIFDVQIGGAEANVAAACSRLGLKVAWISALPNNIWGERVERELQQHGVDCRYVVRLESTRLGLYFLEYGVPPRPIQVLYDRRDSAFARLTPEMVDWAPFRAARIAHISGVTPALGPNSRALVNRVVREATVLSFDVNYRATLWAPKEARAFIDSVLPYARYLFLGESEARTLFGEDGPAERTLERLARLAPRATVALLQGQNGSVVLDAGQLFRPRISHTVQVIDPIGAGDAYVAGYLWACLQGRPSQDRVDTASIVAALKCSTWGDIALISERDILDVVAGAGDVKR